MIRTFVCGFAFKISLGAIATLLISASNELTPDLSDFGVLQTSSGGSNSSANACDCIEAGLAYALEGTSPSAPTFPFPKLKPFMMDAGLADLSLPQLVEQLTARGWQLSFLKQEIE